MFGINYVFSQTRLKKALSELHATIIEIALATWASACDVRRLACPTQEYFLAPHSTFPFQHRFESRARFFRQVITTLSPQDIAARARLPETTAPHSSPRRRHRHNGAQIFAGGPNVRFKNVHETRALAHRQSGPAADGRSSEFRSSP